MNEKIIPILSEDSLEGIKILENIGILEKTLKINEYRVDLDKLFDAQVGRYRGGFDAAIVAVLNDFVRNKNLLNDPYIIIDLAGPEEKGETYSGAGTIVRNPDDVIKQCPRCKDGGDIHYCLEHVWVRSGLYRYEVVRNISTCYKCWWSNRDSIQAEEQARIDSGDKNDWGCRI